MTQSQAAEPPARDARPPGLRSGWRRAVPSRPSPLVLITALALMAAVVTALAPPGSYLLAQHEREVEVLEVRAEALARQAGSSDASGGVAYPDGLQLGKIAGTRAELWRLRRPDGTLAGTYAPLGDLPAPLLQGHAPVPAGGGAPWRIEVVGSFRPALATAALLLLPCAGLGALVFLLLRQVPLRALADALSRAAYLSTHDPLTGLMNRGAFQERLREARRELPPNGSLAVLLISLDRFRPTNDTSAQAGGDALLRLVAQRLSEGLGADGSLARPGSDEFAILQAGAGREAAVALAARLLASLGAPFAAGGRQAEISASIGIALGSAGEPNEAGELLHRAELAMSQAKQEGCTGICVFTPELARHWRERCELEHDLRRALAEGQFRLDYQPLVCLTSGRLLGAEALLRWHRPSHGEVPPDQFIGLAEEIGLIGPIGAWVLQEACREAARWPAPLGIAVNVSPLQFRLPNLCDTVKAALQQAALAPERLELEVTEGMLLRDTQDTLEVLCRLRGFGVRLAMDDFGTGYSSLGYLSRFAFDKIKIDRSFVRHLTHDPKSKAVVRAVLGISHTLGIRAHAEGVESDEQAELLRQEGCEEVQGYLYGRPMPPQQFATLCRQVA